MPANIQITALTIQNILSGASAHADADTTGSIGAEFEVKFTVELSGTDNLSNPLTTWAKRTITVNPGLWVPSGYTMRLPANQGWSVQFPTGTIAGNTYPMALIGAGSQEPAQRNLSCVAFVQSGDPAFVDITFRFRCTMDLGAFITATNLANRERLRRSHVNAQGAFANTVLSVYRNTDTRTLTLLVEARGSFQTVQEDRSIVMGARFYDRNLTGAVGTAEFGGCTVTMTRGGNNVTNLSPYEDTVVEFRWLKNTWNPVGGSAEVMLFDQSNPGNLGGTYLEDYGIPDPVPTIAIVDAGTHWTVTRTVTGGELIPARTYGIAVIVPIDDGSGAITNTFLAQAIANAAPNPIDLDPMIAGVISDYNHDAGTDNVISTVVDRVNCRHGIDAVAYDAEAATKPWAVNLASDLRRVSVTIETLDGIQWTKTANKIGGVWQEDGPKLFTITEGPVMLFDFVLHLGYLNDAGRPDFGNESVQIHWVFGFYYAPLSWSVDYRRSQRVMVKEFQNFSAVIDAINLLDFDTGLPIGNLCDSNAVIVEVLLDPALSAGKDWNIRAFAAPEPFGYVAAGGGSGTVEEEGYTSPVGLLPAGSTPIIEGVPEEFTLDRAVFYFDVSQIQEGSKWRVYAIAQPTEIDALDPCIGAPLFPDSPVAINRAVLAQSRQDLENESDGLGVTVSGTGEAGANALYPPAGMIGGKNAYHTGGTWQIMWFGSKWNITNGSMGYESTENVDEPWQVTLWTPVGGASIPAPVVNTGVTSGGTLGIGHAVLVYDHTTSVIPSTDLFELNTGCRFQFVGYGAGIGGTGWGNLYDPPNGTLFVDLSSVYYIKVGERSTTLYSSNGGTGNFAEPYLYGLGSSAPASPTEANLYQGSLNTGEQSLLEHTPDVCREGRLQYSEDGGSTWAFASVGTFADVPSDPTYPAPMTPTTYPGTADALRIAWYRDNTLQGYSYPTAI